MKHKAPRKTELSPAEVQLVERLRQHPALSERFQQILEISARADGKVQKADEIEARLIEELRRLGKETMESWASAVESTLAQELQQREPSAGVRKKKR